jgi:amino acid adenylation domain-containing protein
MAGHFQNLMEGMVSDPDTRLSDLPLLTEAERHRIVVEWNNTTAEYPRDKCIHKLFQQKAEQTPSAEAVVFEQKKLTYGELNSQANQLARRLRAAGSGTGELVGICLERSIDMVIGILGILKAGGAYVPLDPSYPADRLNFMLEDAKIRLLLTEKKHRKTFPAYKGAIINLDDEQATYSFRETENPDVPLTADGLAYVIYTSGSTGKPKGVCVPHRAVSRLVTNTNYIALGPSDVVAHLSNCSFDAATFEIWGALLNGARLVGLGHAIILSPEDFAAALQTHKINTLFLTTALFNQMAHAVPDAFRTVRSLLFGGETADPECVRRVVHAGPPERLIHVYGPTENTTFTSWHLVEDVPEKALTVPIGRPVSNTRIYLLDSHRHPVPVGVPGELHAGGDGLARGYLNRPELTAEKFITSPFSTAGDARLYRTGDLARYKADGTIEFLGRIDNQIKIRGFRVEPEEIEAVLGQHDSVHSAAVAVREDTPGDKRLVAYVVQKSDATENDLRTFLKEKLPDYMVPSYFVFIDALPLTPNGKVDRRALPRLQGMRTAMERTIEAPRDKVERRLTKLWENVLGTRPIGIKDNFFDLGGHSLLAARAAAKIKKQLGKDVPMDIIFRAPTVEQLAEVLRGPGASSGWSALLPLQTAGSRPPFFWVQGGAKAFLHRYLGPDQPLYALSHEGQDGKPAQHTRVEAIAAHYLREIRTVQNGGPYLLGGFCFGALVALEMAQQLKKQGQKVSLLVLVEPPAVCLRHLSKKVWKRHLHELSSLGHREKLLRVFKKLKGAGEETVKKFKKRGRMMICKTYFRAGRPLPHSLRKFYIKETQRRATRAYVPQIYPGNILIFHTKALAKIGRQGWSLLSSSGVEIHEVPDAKHNTIMDQPYVGIWGRMLSTYLQDLYADDTATSNKNR